LLGLALTAFSLLFGAAPKLRAGVLEVTLEPRRRPRDQVDLVLPFVAVTLGHVVIARSTADQRRLRAHESIHVAQYERWGPLFLVAYPAESMLQFLLGRRPYLDNRFEVQARRLSTPQSRPTPCSDA
jgi:hypothetical protein